MEKVVEKVRNELRNNADEKTKASGERFFKEEVIMYGVKSSVTQRIAKEAYKLVIHLEKPAIFQLCEKLWRSGYMEESFIACNWSYFVHKQYKKDDFLVFESWLARYVSNWAAWIQNYVDNWASCDTLCNHSVGTLVEMYPDLISGLKRWALSGNRWVKRGAAVSLIIPARKGLFHDDIFEIADILHSDRDDMVQKGYGWMLKAASQAHQKSVFDYVVSRKSTMPRTALRYAIEKMPPDMKKQAMSK